MKELAFLLSLCLLSVILVAAIITAYGQFLKPVESSPASGLLINASYIPISIENAKDSVRVFLNDPSANVTYVGSEVYSYMLEDYYLFNVDSSLFKVNMKTGAVEDALISYSVEQNVTLSKEQAKAIGQRIASLKYANFSKKNMVLTCVRLQNNTPNTSEYWLEWHEFLDGVQVPSYIFITINPNNGSLLRYSAADRPVWISLRPEISEGQAVRIARDQFMAKGLNEIQATLEFQQLGRDQQRLVWAIELRGKPNRWAYDGGFVQVDAESGKVYYVRNYDMEDVPRIENKYNYISP